jgi:hypothetical protein
VEIIWGPDRRVLKRVVLDDPDGEPRIEDVSD